MMIFYDAFTENSVPRYELYVYKDKEIIKTTSLAEFKEKLTLIPAGEKLHYNNTCGGGTHHGLDQSVLENLKYFVRTKVSCFKRETKSCLVSFARVFNPETPRNDFNA